MGRRKQLYSYAESLAGPWSAWAEFADDGSNTYHSQVSFVLPWGDNSAIYMGDRWQPSNLMRSTYVWLPLELEGSSVWLTNRGRWVPDVESRRWGVGPTETQYEGEDATLSNGAVAVGCSGCSGGLAAGYLGGEGAGRMELGVRSEETTKTTVRLRYTNGDTSERYGLVTVNGVEHEVAFLPTQDGQTPGSAVLHCDLAAGDGNTVVVEALDGGYAADIDQVIVPEK